LSRSSRAFVRTQGRVRFMQTSDHVVARSSGAIVRAVPVAPSQLRVAARSAGWGRISAGMAWLTACARLAGAGTGVDVAHAPARRFSAARRLGALPALCLLGMLALLMAAPVRAQSVLDGFDPGANGVVTSLVVQPDGKVLVGGDFTQLGGQTRNLLARLNPDGRLDAAYEPGAHRGGCPVAVQADGKVLVGGVFTEIGGQPRNFLARLNPGGSLDATFDPGANGAVWSLAVQADGKVLVGGFFTELGGQPRNRLARLNP